MAQQFDISLKLLLRDAKGVFARMLFGGPVAEWLNVEQPRVTNPRTDLLARVGPDPDTGETSLCHVELQKATTAGWASGC